MLQLQLLIYNLDIEIIVLFFEVGEKTLIRPLAVVSFIQFVYQHRFFLLLVFEVAFLLA